jgi:hypothetical protein
MIITAGATVEWGRAPIPVFVGQVPGPELRHFLDMSLAATSVPALGFRASGRITDAAGLEVDVGADLVGEAVPEVDLKAVVLSPACGG